MTRRAHEAHGDALQRGSRRGQQQVDGGRAQPDHDDARPAHPPAGTVVVLAADVRRATRGRLFPARPHRRRGRGLDVEDQRPRLRVDGEAPSAELRIDPHLHRLQPQFLRNQRVLLQRLREFGLQVGERRMVDEDHVVGRTAT